MEDDNKDIELLSGNWLNNASIVGFLYSLEKMEKKEINLFLRQDGRCIFPKDLFNDLEVNKRYFNKESQLSSIVAKAPIYRNYLQTSEKGLLRHFVKSLTHLEENGQCDIMTKGYSLPINEVMVLKKAGLGNFMERISDFNMIFHADIAPSLSAFPNAYWNFKSSNKICHLFAFLVIHQHLAFTTLSDFSKIFINAPSFKLMYELNKFLKNFAGKENRSYRNLLAMSVVELSIRTNAALNTWAGMDIEIIAIKNKDIEFINIPYDTIKLLSNRKIAELISSIGDFKIMNLVIDQKWDDLVELGYRLLKISMNGIGKEDRDFLSQFYAPDGYRNENTIKSLANKLLKLYSLIQDRIK